ncbi:MAG TPA: Xaa-Pro peptidase family protein [Treponemataceae bacterium]|jgi:Xaa-Pro dipeptidase|nr:Xaa-Pro peptidase family protein [Treponemataceae bacterium]HQC26803.1 Xaa-Pro peptidase family protein [Treponemataceae bacterium]
MNEIYKARRQKLADWMSQNDISAVIFVDNEEKRSPEIRYFTNHAEDALLIITKKGSSILCPWDENLAKEKAHVDLIVPYTKYELKPIKASLALLKTLKVPGKTRVEIPSSTSYPEFLRYVDTLADYDVLCNENFAHEFVTNQRQVKDAAEIKKARKAAEITNTIIDAIAEALKKNAFKTEMDVALFIERSCREHGCEGTSFPSLVANPSRSFAIHCFPNYTSGNFPASGLSILDFGVNYDGYASDVTLTIAKGSLSAEQEKQISLVEKAYDLALPFYAEGTPVKTPAVKVDEFFAKAKRKMPHSLGHGMGLQIHEAPWIRTKTSSSAVFKVGMIASLEPGLYDPKIGGCRLENTILITETGPEPLTRSRVLRLP